MIAALNLRFACVTGYVGSDVVKTNEANGIIADCNVGKLNVVVTKPQILQHIERTYPDIISESAAEILARFPLAEKSTARMHDSQRGANIAHDQEWMDHSSCHDGYVRVLDFETEVGR